MGLNGALQVGRTGLLTSQVALQVAGNNLANLSTDGYHRQRVDQVALPGQNIGIGLTLGSGVGIEAITRITDEALEARLRASITDESGQLARQELLRQIETIQNEFSDVDLSTRLSKFFNAWSQLANNPQDLSLRTLVLQEGATLANYISDMRAELGTLRAQADQAAGAAAVHVNDLCDQIADLNRRISLQEGSAGNAAALRDQRDGVLQELAQYLDVSTVEQSNGAVDVYVGSIPIVLGTVNRGVELRTDEVNGESQISLVLASDQSPLDISTGQLGAIVEFRQSDLQDALDTLDTFAGQLIYQVNRLHSQGQGLEGFSSVSGSYQVLDSTAALTDADATGLDFIPGHGSFVIRVTQKSTGISDATTINIDLDGIGPGSDTTLSSLAAALDAVGDISATVTADGRLSISADSDDFTFSFSDDTSGALAALGLNGFFTGADASDIDISSVVRTDPTLLAASGTGELGDNSNALAIAGLRDSGVSELNGFSLTDYWARHVEDFAVRLAGAGSSYNASRVVRENLQAQQQSISGVNAEEETISLLQAQRAFQASARFISVVDELMQTLLNMV
ncbi:MAG: flagellar hook-associated protein FlgK [Phycisphaeraceae bacterium]|nr:flagellar hook-associated protein FlgK [Phycisphaeraceae bacterium]